MPVFHDDQHGTAIVVLAALMNAVKLRGCTMSEIRITINGGGRGGDRGGETAARARGSATSSFAIGRARSIRPDRAQMDFSKAEIARVTNRYAP